MIEKLSKDIEVPCVCVCGSCLMSDVCVLMCLSLSLSLFLSSKQALKAEIDLESRYAQRKTVSDDVLSSLSDQGT